MGVLERDPIPKLCFAMVLTICKHYYANSKDFLSWSYRYELSQVDTSDFNASDSKCLGFNTKTHIAVFK